NPAWLVRGLPGPARGENHAGVAPGVPNLQAPIGDDASGVTIQDLLDSAEFMSRKRRRVEPVRWARALEMVEKRLAENANAGLQTLVEIAVEACDADSSGISLEEETEDGKLQFRWVA